MSLRGIKRIEVIEDMMSAQAAIIENIIMERIFRK
jgi:hypothetical protein